MNKFAIEVNEVSKKYKLGSIGGGTLKGDLQSWFARMCGKEDPNIKLGNEETKNEEFFALKNISFIVKKGERVGIIGHNGAGKSTLLKLLSRVTAPTSGWLGLNGRVASMLEVGTGFHGELTGIENIYMNGAILGMTRAEITKKLDEIVAFAEMEKFVDTPVKRYSSGMYVKLAFAVAAHLDSEILIMDEVLAVGDMKFQQKCLGKMDDVSEQDGKTVLYVSHNMNTVRQLCNRCIVLDHGKIIYNGDVEEAISSYMEMDHNDILKEVELDHIVRPNISWGLNIRLANFEFLLPTTPLDVKDDEVKFKLVINSSINEKNIHIRTIVYCRDDIPIGMARTKKEAIELVVGMNEVSCSMVLPGLCLGDYYMNITLFKINEFGTDEIIDGVRKCISFRISDFDNEHAINWNPNWWGRIVMKEIRLLGGNNQL